MTTATVSAAPASGACEEPALPPLTSRHAEQFREEGFFVLEAALPPATLEMLRSECARMITECDAEMTRQQTDVIGLSHRGSRYFLGGGYKNSAVLRAFVLSEFMAALCRVTLGDDAYFFGDLFVVKAAEAGMKFGWHQDGGYVGHAHRPYFNCWCPLDDVNEANGTVYLLPYTQAGTREILPHTQETGSNDKVGYFGDHPGVPVIVPAGSLVVFANNVFHRSGPNTTDNMRRAFSVEYTPEPMFQADGTTLFAAAIPILRNGEYVGAQSLAVLSGETDKPGDAT